MTSALRTTPRRIAVVGNPNAGKTTLFNALTGHRARVGNYSGVTVEKREGRLARCESPVVLLDLPGTYSLKAVSTDERIVVDVLTGQEAGESAPDLLLVVADATRLERSLYLVSQVLELRIPTILALNMADTADADGWRIDTEKLGAELGIEVVRVAARTGRGLEELRSALARSDHPTPNGPTCLLPKAFRDERDRILGSLQDHPRAGYFVTRALFEGSGPITDRLAEWGGAAILSEVDQARSRLAEHGWLAKGDEAVLRHKALRSLAEKVVSRTNPDVSPASERRTEAVDRLLTHRVWGTVIFLAAMAVVFQSIYTWAAPLMDAIDGGFAALGGWIGPTMPEGPIRSFVVDGVLAGVGGVLIFLPQIMILFFFIALLEDVGYMARAAYLADAVLSRVGLSGRSFIPMLSSFACAIPGIMATRSMDNARDRLLTILVAPLMSCSARLPVYALLIAAFIPEATVAGVFNLQGIVLLVMYLLGVAVALPVALLLKRTLLRDARATSFVIELPPYRRPTMRNVFHRVYTAGHEFVVNAGTLILAVSIVVWALAYYPRPASVAEEYAAAEAALVEAHESGALGEEAFGEALASLESEQAGAYLRQSYLARMGRWIEPAVAPLGWDWRLGTAAIASFPAREVIVATLGVIFDVGEADEESAGLLEALRSATWPDGRPLFTIPVALGVMVFFALCLQCAATLAVMRKETASWRWPVFAFVYMTTLAYLGALLTYQVGSLFL